MKLIKKIIKIIVKIILKNSSKEYQYNFYYARYCENFRGQIIAIIRMLRRYGKNSTCRGMYADYEENCVYLNEKVIDKILKYDIVSFDIFDTLIFRKVRNPVDVFKIVEKKEGCWQFKRKRQKSEMNARRLKYGKKNTREVTLEEIYETRPLCKLQNSKKLLSAELAVEKKVCFANDEMKNLISVLKQEGKEIIVISDMYLSKNFLKDLLFDNGFGEMDNIFISCEFEESKSDGKIFGYIRELLGNDKTICHIGDNFYSDVVSAKGKISKAIHYIK